ncbi:DUF6716 putative glycosyltransferase [Amnibacterium endophyticum]|uniref:DUF6716 putative glycosyltransferase n=1 Tax=Amnibacterium endophyticum TaxID=2109337 RepID=A0ABW4LEH8_9MICO
MHAVLITGFDSSLKWASRLAEALAARGIEPRLVAPTSVAAHRLGDAQIRAVTERPVRTAAWPQLVAEAAAADVAVPVLDGPNVERFFRDVHATGGRPVLGAGYVGMVLYDTVSGYLGRSLADVLAVNSRTDHAAFRLAATELGLPDGNLLLTGLALLPAAPAAPRRGPIRTVLLADQPTVPRQEADRVLLWDRLLRYAERHPDRQVLLKPRHRPGEDTFHRMRVAPETWAASRDLPPNLRIDHTPIDRQAGAVDLLLTVSSTAALEAVAAGTRVAFVADRVDDGSLNPPLLPSGLLRRFEQIERDELGEPHPEWLADVFPAADGLAPAERFAERLAAVAAGDAPRLHDALWDSGVHRARRETEAARASFGSARRRLTPRRIAAGGLRRALAVLVR